MPLKGIIVKIMFMHCTQFSKIFFFTLVTIFSLNNLAQSVNIEDAVKQALDESSRASSYRTNNANEASSPGYVDNSVDQYNALSNLIEERKWLEKQIEARKKLATELCMIDQKACFLIQNYEIYKDSEASPRTISELELFGLEIFSGYPLNFEQVDNTTTSSDYILGPGDLIEVNILGPEPDFLEMTIQRDGTINIPNYGKLDLASLSFADANQALNDFVRSVMVGSSASISLKKLKNISVNLGGSTRYPGTYKISGQSTALNLIASAGGLYGMPSLRNITINSRDGASATEDLYNYLVYGNSADIDFLRNGDIVSIPYTDKIVYVLGNVNRPAIYEFIDGEDTNSLLQMALGPKPESSPEMSLVRLAGDSTRGYTVINVSSESPEELQQGDILIINPEKNVELDGVELIGAIKNPGKYSLSSKARLSSVLNIHNDLQKNAYLPFFVIERSYERINAPEYVFGNLVNEEQYELIDIFPRDKVFIFSLEDIDYLNSIELTSFFKNALIKMSSRDFMPAYDTPDQMNIDSSVQGDMNTLSNLDALTSKFESQFKVLEDRLEEVSNVFRDPADIDYSNKQSLCLKNVVKFISSKFLKESFQKTSFHLSKTNQPCTSLLLEHDFLLTILLNNSIIIDGDLANVGLFPAHGLQNIDLIFRNAEPVEKLNDFNLTANNTSINDLSSSINIDDFSFLKFSKKIPDRDTRFMTLLGEFNNPGTYPIFDGDKITDLYERAGGLKNSAYPLGAILTRENLKSEEERMLKVFRNNLTEVLTNSIANGYLKQNPTDLIALLDVMSQASSVNVSGRLISELDPSIKDTTKDIPVFDGDKIFMPKRENTISVSGFVLNPSSVIYSPNFSVMDYIEQTGGLKEGSDTKNIYVINPNGTTFKLSNQRIFSFRNNDDIYPGATIIVPRKARNLDSFGLVEAIAPTLASLSVTAASIAAIQD